MSFFALGVNHQTASVELREQIAFNAERLAALLLEQNQHSSLNDLVVVSTCNRTEVYAMTEDADSVLTWLAQVNNIDVKQLIHHVYRYENAQAVTHLMRVASGLDSLMLGEPQILGQVKSALALSKDAETVSPELNSVFEYAFYAAKRVRSETSVGSHAVSMGYAVAQLASQVFSHTEKLTVMVVAAGEMNSLVAKHLAEMGVAKILICNRSRERADLLAQEIAHQVDVEIIPFAELAQNLHRADVVSSCTGSLHQVIEYSDVKVALKKRRYQQMLMVDLAVPRDIDPKVESLDNVYLYGVDDLQSVIDENLAQRRQAAVEAEIMVNQLATQLMTQQKVKEASGTIQAYRQHSEEVSQKELAHALEALQHGHAAEQVMQEFAHRLTQKLMHPTSILLREAAKAENPDYFEWLQQHLQDVFEHERKPRQ
ncbi:glutamyl-tRNA reductase [Acinetobacter gyllenbergii]|uniref:Glutamyl-tRNA reductase n=1 Tax=Acinetobacter gyllenbergii CIP 110306 = MTCC 11365 TaxID=1217657 RepID=A0A829HCN3_9GAMM|nr:glutamyl-tRNA reductase [Acinetobacter gyllenbergii]EPF73138.1 glutamyl-tRNA reductase [Acinetobacter gyllenbergii CIP 110306 = MTCC 11365]EPH30801.1 Glutamyl-tRNA reductase [Acinetobacter gyllenbergii CIP 110306 = MTCC 11365]ESK42151.1 glutamyl-tRNA reductase [Acinetobacter gyllenbergii NIPH 230]MCU4582988.1 glutamyl-tRNA reductase [Acinetobacter gyllenbergii]OBY73584.1 glutamyl-tRNA reductase [Acinetobacter gyllenbergii]